MKFFILTLLSQFSRRKYTENAEEPYLHISFVTNVIGYNDMQDLGNMKITSEKKLQRERWFN